MIDWAVRFAKDTAAFNSIFGICLYWLPMISCIVGYTMRTARNIQKDKISRVESEKDESYYIPTDTLGDLLCRAIVSVVPICNLWCVSFDIFPMVFGKALLWIQRTFNQPLVPKRKEYNECLLEYLQGIESGDAVLEIRDACKRRHPH